MSEYEQQFLDALPHVTAIVRHIGRRYRLSPDESEDFGALVRLRLLEDDYLILRRFQGRSSLRTYLTTVVTRLFLDERVKAWGKWRPSASAVRLGPVAVLLERTMGRDGLTLDEAIGTLTARGTAHEGELRSIASHLPVRVVRRVVDDESVADWPSGSPGADHIVLDSEARVCAHRVRIVLADLVTRLPPRERLLIKLRFVEGASVADIARILREPQKPLYRRLERLLGDLRAELTARGISREHVEALTRAIDADGAPGPVLHFDVSRRRAESPEGGVTS